MKTKILITTLTLLLIAALTTCKKEPEVPTGSNKIEFGQTITDSVAWHVVKVSTEITGTGGNPITQHGHCWSIKNKPTTDDDKTTFGKLDAPTTYNSELTGLQDNTTYYIRPYVIYANGVVYGTEETIKTLKIEPPQVSTVEVTNIKLTSATGGGNVGSYGGLTITARGVCWNITGNLTLENSIGHTADGSGTGNFTSTITGLTENTHYYVAAYATNEKGTGYGEVISFTTIELTLPTVETADIINITDNSATGGGNVISCGNGTITARGVCWNTTGNPTLENSTGHTIDGSGIGNFTSTLTALAENTNYYVAAYVTNEKGIGYGEVKSFTTLTLPTVETADIINITGNSATCGGNVTFDGNGTVTARGVCWNTTGNPKLENSIGHTINDSGTGSFTSNITGLT